LVKLYLLEPPTKAWAVTKIHLIVQFPHKLKELYRFTFLVFLCNAKEKLPAYNVIPYCTSKMCTKSKGQQKQKMKKENHLPSFDELLKASMACFFPVVPFKFWKSKAKKPNSLYFTCLLQNIQDLLEQLNLYVKKRRSIRLLQQK
jgi:hypothetical protein